MCGSGARICGGAGLRSGAAGMSGDRLRTGGVQMMAGVMSEVMAVPVDNSDEASPNAFRGRRAKAVRIESSPTREEAHVAEIPDTGGQIATRVNP